MSGWLLMDLPGAVFVGGLSEARIGVGLLVGTYLNWRIVARRLRVYSHVCNDSITIPDFVCNRFRDPTGLSRSVAAVLIGLVFHLHLGQRNLTLADVGGDQERVFMVMIRGRFRDGFLMRRSVRSSFSRCVSKSDRGRVIGGERA